MSSLGETTAWTPRGSARPGPAVGLLLTEPARGLTNLATLPLAALWLAFAPRGDGHGVLVLPGLMATDASTGVLRQFLRRLGYPARGWRLGRNIGPTSEVLDQLPGMLSSLATDTGGPVSVIGWSLGGIYARELARQHPDLVRRVITLGSPFALTDARQSHARHAYERRARLHSPGRVPGREQIRQPIPVPSTAVYSRLDGIVSWRACTSLLQAQCRARAFGGQLIALCAAAAPWVPAGVSCSGSMNQSTP